MRPPMMIDVAKDFENTLYIINLVSGLSKVLKVKEGVKYLQNVAEELTKNTNDFKSNIEKYNALISQYQNVEMTNLRLRDKVTGRFTSSKTVLRDFNKDTHREYNVIFGQLKDLSEADKVKYTNEVVNFNILVNDYVIALNKLKIEEEKYTLNIPEITRLEKEIEIATINLDKQTKSFNKTKNYAIINMLKRIQNKAKKQGGKAR